jgi:hypothetical protein
MCVKLNEDAAKKCTCKFAHLCRRRKNAGTIEVLTERLSFVPAVAPPLSSQFFDLKLKLHAEKGAHF